MFKLNLSCQMMFSKHLWIVGLMTLLMLGGIIGEQAWFWMVDIVLIHLLYSKIRPAAVTPRRECHALVM